jgi:hypothetical protein
MKKRGRPATATTALVPAASRAPEVLSPVEAELNGEAIELFAKAVGGRAQLADVLSVAGASSAVDKIALYLLDPKYATVSLRRLCGFLGITVADLFTAYRKAMVARSHIEATHIIASRLPPIVADVMDRALSDPTVERQKVALELGQLLEKKGGIVMQQNTIAASALASTGTGALEQLHQAVGDLLFSPSRRRESAPVIDIAEPPHEDRPRTDPREPPWPLPTPDPEPEEPDDDDENGGGQFGAAR